MADMAMHKSIIFPTATNLTCTIAAHDDADTWSAWVEVVDSGATSLSTLVAALPGHIERMWVSAGNQASTTYMSELAYGEAKVNLGNNRVVTGTANLPVFNQVELHGPKIPAGETIYARVMCKTAGAKTLTVGFSVYNA